jgi:hypothetical protein
MLRATDDILELRHWVEERCGQPCRFADGKLGLCFGEELAGATLVGWDEFEPTFCAGLCVFVYDDSPGCNHHFIGSREEARGYVAAADPRASGSAGPTP